MKADDATCGGILAYEISVFSIHVDVLPKYGSACVTVYFHSTAFSINGLYMH